MGGGELSRGAVRARWGRTEGSSVESQEEKERMEENQDPMAGGVGWAGEWGSATERLEGQDSQGLPRHS